MNIHQLKDKLNARLRKANGNRIVRTVDSMRICLMIVKAMNNRRTEICTWEIPSAHAAYGQTGTYVNISLKTNNDVVVGIWQAPVNRSGNLLGVANASPEVMQKHVDSQNDSMSVVVIPAETANELFGEYLAVLG